MPNYTGQTWMYWTNNGTSSASTNVMMHNTASGNVFGYWVQQTGTSSIYGNNVWTSWANNTSSGARLYSVVPDPYANETDEEKAARLERQAVQAEEYRRKERRRRIRADVARIRAQRLLHSVLSDEQLEEFEKTRAFTLTVIDSRTGAERYFRVNQGKAGNVSEVDADGRAFAKYCAHLYGSEPETDTMIAQKLMLETDVAAFERIANVTRIRAA